MKIIINHSSMIPIYEQIVNQIKSLIVKGELKEYDVLPSVRLLSKELKISALTVKKAYDYLEEEGFTSTIHGKGTYVKVQNAQLIYEEQKKEIEAELECIFIKAKQSGITKEEVKELTKILLEETYD
ncbi:MAG: GntR family transcriptional regulator [Erysipelotrichaceae bacterium]|nr:GntR family transcriptional regulator [Erysipelotrichaceae bacterium]